jgi:hypothetical protein
MAHSPVLVDEANGTRYAICSKCDSNIESWYFDEEEDRVAHWSNFGIFVTFENGSGYLDKKCSGDVIVKTIKRKLVSA